jgi:adenine-specific DNA-methyltransferase
MVKKEVLVLILEVKVFRLFPIKIASKETQKPIINLVDQILTLKKTNPQADTSDLENEIDELVYQLYELTPEEVEVVKNS